MTGPLKNNRHERFVLGLLKGKTQTAAAIEAGYSPKWARSFASDLCTKPNVRARKRELEAVVSVKVVRETIANREERQEILTEIARGKLPDYQTETGILVTSDSPNTSAIESIETITRHPRESQAGGITIKRPVVQEALRNTIFKRDGNQCLECGATEDLQIDHIVSLSKGGMTVLTNLQTLCETCNKHKAGGKKSQPVVITKIQLRNPIPAIAELNKMDGDYAPERHQVLADILIEVTHRDKRQLTDGDSTET